MEEISKPSLGIDLIQKCLWILHKKFNFQTTKKLNIKYFQYLKQSLAVLLEIKFPMLISIESKLATYHHVVVVWKEMVTDYESMYTYSLTKDALRQICSVNTTFQQSRNLQSITGKSEYSGLGHRRIFQTREFY